MENQFDKEKVLECMFDPKISEILAELENGGKKLSYLSEKFQLSETEIRNSLSYLLEHGFVNETKDGENVVFSVDGDKLSAIIEENKNFQGVEDGLTELDSYLN